MQLHFLENKNFDFIGMRYIFFTISLLLVLTGVVSLTVKRGPAYGIDFTGGLLTQIAFDKPVDMDKIRSVVGASGIESFELQSSGEKSIIIRTKKSSLDQLQIESKLKQALETNFTDSKFVVERTEYVGPAVGKHLVKQAFWALIFSFIGIVIYVAFRFKSFVWGTAGIIGIVHDVFAVVTVFSIMNKEMNLTIIAALLTVAGYSINDTIVIFDRIRENLRLMNKQELDVVINKSINQTLSRTLITTFTVFLVVLTLFIFGGQVIHDFAYAMLIGTFVGVYSTVFICSPMVYEWTVYIKKRSERLRASYGKKK